MITTEHLTLRRWREADREPFAAMSADPQVMDWLGGQLMTRAQSDALIDRIEGEFEDTGFGHYALERTADGTFLGFTGLARVGHGPPTPQGVEIGWRLARHAWGHGYATEAASSVLREGLDRFGLAEIVSFTARTNLRSQAVMDRIGLIRRPDLDFDHPFLAKNHPLLAHVVYATAGPRP